MSSSSLFNVASSFACVLVSGCVLTTCCSYGVVSGGFRNSVTGAFGVVLGGRKNTVSGEASLGAGTEATVVHDYAGVFGFRNSSCASVDDYSVNFCTENGFYVDGYALNTTQIAVNEAGVAGLEESVTSILESELQGRTVAVIVCVASRGSGKVTFCRCFFLFFGAQALVP